MLYSPPFRKLLTESVVETTYRQLYLQDLVGDLPWRYRLSDGTLLFGNGQDAGRPPQFTFNASVLGTDDGSTFLWAAGTLDGQSDTSHSVSDNGRHHDEDDDDDTDDTDDNGAGDGSDAKDQSNDEISDVIDGSPLDDADQISDKDDGNGDDIEETGRATAVGRDDDSGEEDSSNVPPEDDGHADVEGNLSVASMIEDIADDEDDDDSVELGQDSAIPHVPKRLSRASRRVRELGRELGVAEFAGAAVTTCAGAPYTLHVLAAAAAGALDAPAYFCDYPAGVALVLEDSGQLPPAPLRSPPAEAARVVAAVAAARALAPDQCEALRAFVMRRHGRIETRDDNHWCVYLAGATPIEVTLDHRRRVEELALARDT
jgi:hypothetical protein